ncbi:MAG: hypothetical protein J5I98_15415 [Phaeodactylibacter sp.]|nr:hypothetical protein [Phaeodactylibacter sp.]
MKVFYSALFLVLLHGIAHAQCGDFVLTVSGVQPPSCPNYSDGAITLSIAGAQGTVSYAWSEAGLNSPTIDGLAPGTYSVTATDDAGCQAVETVMLEAAVVADAGPDVEAYCGAGPVSLGGVANTAIYFSSDITPIEFFDSNQELVAFRGISGEVGFAPAPDSFDPASSDSLYVEIGSATASVGDVVCLPLRVYNFTDIVGAAFTINYDFAHLNFIEVTGLNPNLPGFTEAANMATPNTGLNAGFIILNYFGQSLSGVSLSDGSTLFTICFEVVGISGTSAGPDITYQWAGPNDFTSTEPFPQVAQSGAYTLRVTDTSRADCWAEDEVVVIIEPDSIGVTLGDTITSCLSQPVSLEPEVLGGQPPFSYLWSTGDTTATIAVTSSNAPVDYSVTITSTDGCTGLASARVEAENTSPPVVVVFDQPFCPGQPVGLTAVVTGGAPPYTFIWNDGFATTNPNRIVAPTASTAYSANVVDANGCRSVPDTANVIEQPEPQLDLGPDHYLCTPEPVLLSGPSGAASYAWSDGQATQTAIVQPTQTSTYYLTITNSFGCSATDTVVVFVGLQNIDIAAIACDDNATPADPTDDTFTFQADIGGSPGGSWVSNLGPTGSYGQAVTFGPFPISAGDVTLMVVDGNNPSCNTTTVVSPPLPCSVAPPCGLQAVVQEILCDDNGTPADTTDDAFTLEILVTGGPGGGWVEDSSGLSGGYGVPFAFGPYPADYGHVGLIFRDADDPSCVDVFDLYTPVPCTIDCQQNPIQINFDIVFPRCNGASDGEAFAGVEGGAGGYAYQWSNGATTLANLNLPAGSYSLTVTDILGCQATGLVTLTEPPLMALQFTTTPAFCPDGSDGSIEIFVTGGTPPYTYFVIGPAGTGPVPAVIMNPPPGTYEITVTDVNGCSVTEIIDYTIGNLLSLDIEVTQQPDCPSSSNGILTAVASGGQGGYEYQWSTGSTGAMLAGLEPGLYIVTATDDGGCAINLGITLHPRVTADAGPEQTLDCYGLTVALDGSLSATGPTIAYEWTGPNGFLSTQLNPVVSEPGIYTLQVTDTALPGCSAMDMVVVTEDLIPPALISISPDFVSCDSAILSYPLFPGMSISWELPGGGAFTGPVLGVTESGAYSFTITDNANGCTAAGQILVDIDPGACATLKGRLVRDTLADCIPAADEPGIANWLIVIQGGGEVYYAVTQPGGYYEQSVPVGDYEVYPLIPGPLWLPCQDRYPVSLQQPGEMAMLDIPVQGQEPCPELTVDFSMPLLRRCWERSLYFNYCNDGTAIAEDAYVVVALDDFFTFQSATAPLLGQDGNEYTFGIGDVAPGQCGSFIVYVHVSCDALVGQTLCAEAKIFPNAPCFPASPNWSGASLRVEGACEGGEVQFRVENIGAGDMPEPRPCIVIEDGVMLLIAPGSIQLNSGEAFTYNFPANGSTYRIEVEQEPFHPGHSMPAAVLEGCGTNPQGTFSTGFVNQLAPDDADPFIDIECREVVGSYDPNDKHGFPRGYGDEHFIYPGTDIEYLVQFQNTGNDTAFLVVIRDTLSEYLDITSVQPGAASHPYAWDIDSNNILVFTFEDILLPDSTTNLAGSQGFVEFKVSQQDSLPLGTVIENSAAIYFDINEPIITNTTFHTLGYGFIEAISFTPQTGIPELDISVAPNPMGEWALLQLGGWPGGEGLFELFDLQGRRLREQRFSGAAFRFERRGLPAGLYAFRIVGGQGRWGSGRLVVGQD